MTSSPLSSPARQPLAMPAGTAAVCGIVVTYHPDDAVTVNLRALREEVDRLVVVDNGSRPEELAALIAAAGELGFPLIQNGANLGIATALNIGVRWAQAAGCGWVLLFDQDSRVTPGFRTAMLGGFAASAPEPPLGLLVPRYVDMRMGNAMKPILEADGRLETAMTSGSLLPMEIFTQFGFFVDAMFIDGVDHEFSLRLRAAGYRLEECQQAVLLHSPGTPNIHRFRWRAKPFLSSNYSHVRRYYQERNKVWLVRRYWRQFPAFSKRQFKVTAKELIKVVIFERHKWRKVRAFVLGWWHGLTGRMGKMPGN